jgi:hypothetical protein
MKIRIYRNQVSGDIIYYTGNQSSKLKEIGFLCVGSFSGRDFGPSASNKMLNWIQWNKIRRPK